MVHGLYFIILRYLRYTMDYNVAVKKAPGTRRQLLKKAGFISAFIAPTVMSFNVYELAVASSGIPIPFPNIDTSGGNDGDKVIIDGDPTSKKDTDSPQSTGDEVGTIGGVGN